MQLPFVGQKNFTPAMELTNIISKEKLTHPNVVFYKFTSALENCFIKNINSPDVYEKTVGDLIERFHRFNFPCPDH